VHAAEHSSAQITRLAVFQHACVWFLKIPMVLVLTICSKDMNNQILQKQK
jgi:hypothetical protein